MCVIVLQWKCPLAISKWRRVKTWITFSTFLRFFHMTLQKHKKSRCLDFEKTLKTYSRTMSVNNCYYYLHYCQYCFGLFLQAVIVFRNCHPTPVCSSYFLFYVLGWYSIYFLVIATFSIAIDSFFAVLPCKFTIFSWKRVPDNKLLHQQQTTVLHCWPVYCVHIILQHGCGNLWLTRHGW